MHEGGIRTPMLARWPGVIPRGTTTDHISGFQDILPTICELIGQPVPKQNDGISFLPTLRGQKNEQRAHKYLYFEFCKGPQQRIFSQAVRMGNWKAYRQAGKPLELFNLAMDPYEKNDLASSKPDLVAKMKSAIKEAHKPLPLQ